MRKTTAAFLAAWLSIGQTASAIERSAAKSPALKNAGVPAPFLPHLSAETSFPLNRKPHALFDLRLAPETRSHIPPPGAAIPPEAAPANDAPPVSPAPPALKQAEPDGSAAVFEQPAGDPVPIGRFLDKSKRAIHAAAEAWGQKTDTLIFAARAERNEETALPSKPHLRAAWPSDAASLSASRYQEKIRSPEEPRGIPASAPKESPARIPQRAQNLSGELKTAWSLITFQEVIDPPLFSGILAASVMALIPVAGATAVHEFGHYFAAKTTKARVAAVRFYIPGALNNGVVGHVDAFSDTAVQAFAIPMAGPVFTWAYRLALAGLFLVAGPSLSHGHLGGGLWSFLAWVGYADLICLNFYNAVHLMAASHHGDWSGAGKAWRLIRFLKTKNIVFFPIKKAVLQKFRETYGYSDEMTFGSALRLLNAAAAQAQGGMIRILGHGKSMDLVLLKDGQRPGRPPVRLPSKSAVVLEEENEAIVFSQESAQNIEKLKAYFGCSTQEVFQKAIGLLDYVLPFAEADGSLALSAKGQKLKVQLH